jgi:hypothetical protein
MKRSVRIIQGQFEEVDNAPLVLFRMIFGFLIFAESLGAILTGWVKRAFVDPEFTFSLIGFEWLQPLPGSGMYYYYTVMALCGIAITIGFYYRFSLSVFTIMWTLTYWMQKSHYNNHYYLLILLCLFMLIVPAHGYASLDARRKNAVVAMTCPKWCLSIFKIQLWIVFTYAAINKIYPGWLEGDFIALSFKAKQNYPMIGGLLQNSTLQTAVIYGGILFDLLIINILLWKRTRMLGFILSIGFHLFNSAVFQIGIFPYLMIGMCVLFFEPETIRRRFFGKKPLLTVQRDLTQLTAIRKLIAGAFAIYFVIQIILPLRHVWFKGNAFWTEEGHRLSWRMMLRSKYGSASFQAYHPASDSTWQVNKMEFLSNKQAGAVASKPDMIWQFSQYLQKHYAEQGLDSVQIRVNSNVSLNGGRLRPIIDPTVDLTSVKWQPLRHSDWILSPRDE